MGSPLIGAALGIVAGGAGGFVAGLFELRLRQAANRARRRGGGPEARNEVLVPIWLPGAVVGAVIGAVTTGLWGWGLSALISFSVPVAGWLSARTVALVLDLLKN
jgi:hypothetical protein